MTGRWVSFFSTGMALRSSVKRVSVSAVRRPLSQKITCWFPSARMYSAARMNSFIVAASPFLSITGLFVFPTSFKRS